MKTITKYNKVYERLRQKNLTILDIGCDDGRFGGELIRDGHRVIGVDNNKRAIEQARAEGLETIFGDVEEEQTLASLQNVKIDIVFLLDVLEHLRDPHSLLARLRSVIDADCRLIITGPNLAFWKVRLNLLFGRFDYQHYGIMDKTHLHFYTIAAWKKLIRSAGFEIIYFDSSESFIPLHGLMKKVYIVNNISSFATDILTRLFPGLFSCNVLFEAVPHPFQESDAE